MISLSLSVLSNSLIEIKFTNTCNSTITLVKAQSPLQHADEDYFNLVPGGTFIGKRIKWDLNSAETIDIKGNSYILESVNITQLYTDISYPLTIQSKFPLHIKKGGEIETDFTIKSNKLQIGLHFEEKQFSI
eukprot:NODE_1004_length_2328_cov_0.331090.p3 type:complete len:132 gc:universal NODE_1004_length_2328_cov_0.331090:1543-1148(-)